MIRMRAEATFLFEFGLKFAGGGVPFRERGRCRAGPHLYFRFWVAFGRFQYNRRPVDPTQVQEASGLRAGAWPPPEGT